MPTIGVAISTRAGAPLVARLAYRRTQSPTVGVFDAVDRLEYPDVGLFPNEVGQAPSDAVNAEHIAASVRVPWRTGRLGVAPWAWTRANLLHNLVDRAAVGVDWRYGEHAMISEVSYRRPTFDGDSIWGIFAVDPTTDIRLGWSGFGADVTAWTRRYHGATTAARAYGLEAGAVRRLGRSVVARLTLALDGGFGGDRFGATSAVRFAATERLTLTATLAGWRLAPDVDATWWETVAHGVATWGFGDKYAIHGLLETGGSRFTPGFVRFMGVLDLAFEPMM